MNIDPTLQTSIIQSIANDQLIYMPTDTIPGLVASAHSQHAVELIFQLKKRTYSKPPTIIISSLDQLEELGVHIPHGADKHISTYWPGANSLVLPVLNPEDRQYLHRGKNSLAVRLTANKQLRDIINTTGPLATSSANEEGKDAALSVATARHYFGKRLHIYIDHPDIEDSTPSQIYKLNPDSTVIKLR